jgi:hypothetical protein
MSLLAGLIVVVIVAIGPVEPGAVELLSFTPMVGLKLSIEVRYRKNAPGRQKAPVSFSSCPCTTLGWRVSTIAANYQAADWMQLFGYFNCLAVALHANRLFMIHFLAKAC